MAGKKRVQKRKIRKVGRCMKREGRKKSGASLREHAATRSLSGKRERLARNRSNWERRRKGYRKLKGRFEIAGL